MVNHYISYLDLYIKLPAHISLVVTAESELNHYFSICQFFKTNLESNNLILAKLSLWLSTINIISLERNKSEF